MGVDQRQPYNPQYSSSTYPLTPPNVVSAPEYYVNVPPREPSPTPSELEEVNRPFVAKGWYKQKKYILLIILATIVIVLLILLAVFHKQIDNALKPLAHWLKSKKYGFIIPIAILVVISFPPLFGHEIVSVLCGDAYGLVVGFAIVAAGTLLGEIANYFVFKTFCMHRGRKLERTSWFYACLAKAVQAGGFKMAAMVRLSIIPSHFTTTVFATTGMTFFTFVAAAVVSLPKQLGHVSIGVLLASSNSGLNNRTRRISLILLIVTVLFSILALRYVRKKTSEKRLIVVRERRANGGPTEGRA